MARKTDRNFLVPFEALDIEYLPTKGPEVSDDIQMVYVMGDTSAPVVSQVRDYYARVRIGGDRGAAVAGANRATFELEAVVDLWVIHGQQVVSGAPLFSASTTATLAGHAAPAFNPNGVAGRTAYGTAVPDVNEVTIPTVESRDFLTTSGGIFIPAGTFFRMQGGSNGANTDYICFWRELI